MSIDRVTAAICQALCTALVDNGAFPEAEIAHLPLGDPRLDAGQPAVNVALVLAGPAAATRGLGAPAGLVLSLTYLVSAHGGDSALDAQRLLSAAALALHESPVLGVGGDPLRLLLASHRDIPGRPAVSLLYEVPAVTIAP